MSTGVLVGTELGVENTGGSLEAILYGQNTASQDRHRLMRSIDDHISECEAWCQSLGWHVARAIKDANRSASQRRRKRSGRGSGKRWS